MNRPLIIGTAGHIDHGKTTLIQSLTGIHLDQSPEEKARGITINLGFTSLTLPSTQEISFIDVPGHEKLIRTMISGATGLDAVLLCVSAVDSIMPQTKEHLAILNALGLTQGIIAITMCDLADEEDLELIHEEIQELVEHTFLEHAPIIHTSALQNFGQLELIAALDSLANTLSDEPSSLPFRLPVDRCFSQKGFGTVVTGTSQGSPIQEGDAVVILPEGRAAKIRDIQVHHQHVPSASAHFRVALNLSGVSYNEISRGCIITAPNTYQMSSMIDVYYTHLKDAPTLEKEIRIRLLFGSSEVLGKMWILDAPEMVGGQQYFAQIHLDSPHVFVKGDRCIIRRESPLETLGGAIILDPYPPKIRKRNLDEQLQFLKDIHTGNLLGLIERHHQQGLTIQQAKLLEIPMSPLGDHVYGPKIIIQLQKKLEQTLQQFHLENPLQRGISINEFHHLSASFLSKSSFQALVERSDFICKQKSKLHHKDFKILLSQNQQEQIDKILQAILKENLQGCHISTLNQFPKALLHYLLDFDLIFNISGQLIHPQILQNLICQLRTFFRHTEELTTTDFKDITELSRKYSIPLLEWLDQNQKTLRFGNNRRQGITLDQDIICD